MKKRLHEWYRQMALLKKVKWHQSTILHMHYWTCGVKMTVCFATYSIIILLQCLPWSICPCGADIIFVAGSFAMKFTIPIIALLYVTCSILYNFCWTIQKHIATLLLKFELILWFVTGSLTDDTKTICICGTSCLGSSANN